MIIFPRVFATLVSDINTKLKDSGLFGTETALDHPDSYSASPLAQLVTATVGAQIDTDASIAYMANQLTPQTSTGAVLRKAFAEPLGINTNGKTDEQIRAQVLQMQAASYSRGSLVEVALSDDNVHSANFIKVDDNTAIIAVRPISSDYDWDALGLRFFEESDIGLFDLVGDIEVIVEPSSCLSYKIRQACPVFVAMNFTYRQSECAEFDEVAAAEKISEILNGAFYNVGESPNDILRRAIEGTDYPLSNVKLARRAKELDLTGEFDDATTVTIFGEEVVWAGSDLCEYCTPEAWQDTVSDCLTLWGWEYPIFDPQFITFTRSDAC